MAMVTRLHLDKVLFPQSFHSTQKHLKLFISFLKKHIFIQKTLFGYSVRQYQVRQAIIIAKQLLSKIFV